MAKGKHKSLTSRNQEHSASSEPSTPTTASPKYLNTPEKQDSDLKSYLMKLVEDFKKDINYSLKEIEKNSAKDVEVPIEETQKSLKELQENTTKQVMELNNTTNGESKVLHDKAKFTQYLSTNPALQRIIKGKHQHKNGNYGLKKEESNLTTNLKENSRKNRIPTLTTKIIRTNNYFSLLSLNINGFNSLIKRHRQIGYTNRTQHFSAYRKPTSGKKTDTISE
jgi:phage-related protein